MPDTVNIDREALRGTFAELGADVEVCDDGSVRIATGSVEALQAALEQVAAAHAAAFGPLDEIIDVLSGCGAVATPPPAELYAELGITLAADGAHVPASSVIDVVIALDLAARFDGLLEDRDDPIDAAEELRFLLTAAERRDIGDLGAHAQAAAAALAA